MGRRDISDPTSWVERRPSKTDGNARHGMAVREYAEATRRADAILDRVLDPKKVQERYAQPHSRQLRGSGVQTANAWPGQGLPATEKERHNLRRAAAERTAAENSIALTAQRLEREFDVIPATRQRRLEERRKLGAHADARKKFRHVIDTTSGTRVLGYFDGTPWLLIHDENERREYWYQPHSRDATWSEPAELQVPPVDPAERRRKAIAGVSRAAAQQLRRRKKCASIYVSCVSRLAGGYPDYVSQRICAVTDAVTALWLLLGSLLAYFKHAGIANLYVSVGMQTERERNGDWDHGSPEAKGAAGLAMSDVLFMLALASKVALCFGPQEGAAAALAQVRSQRNARPHGQPAGDITSHCRTPDKC